MALDEAVDRLDAVLKVVDRYEPVAVLGPKVLREAAARRHSVYDVCYVVLARREGATVLTIDARLKKLVAPMGVPVHP